MLSPRGSLLVVFVWFSFVTSSSLQSQVVAVDDASRYSFSTEGVNRWMSNGHRGDLGFGVWNFEAVPHSGSAGRFIGDSTAGAGDINTDGKSFGLFAHPPGSSTPFAAAIRSFDKPVLTTGDSVSFKMAVNFRNGDKGFSVRNRDGTGLFNFNVGRNDGVNGGYYIRNGTSASTTHDNGQRLGGYHGNTVFTFTFTQRERRVDWEIQRSGGLTSSLTGSFPASSGTFADLRFYVSGTDDAAQNPANNFYFNSFVFTPAVLGDAPLTPGERRMPGFVPSYTLRYQDPTANTVTVRHNGDGFTTSYPMTKSGDVWSLDVRTLGLAPGWHTFKFRPNSAWEEDPNRRLYLDPQGRVALPPAVYLTWQRDPTTTMTVHWYNTDATAGTVRYRLLGEEDWTPLSGSSQPFPHTERYIQTAEITGLVPDTYYEFEVDGYDDTFKFRTMPASLEVRPVKVGIGGDVDIGSIADNMTAAISAQDPDFLVVGGDHAYEDARAVNFWKWYRYMDSWFTHARAPDGRMIPLVMAIGNHEVRYGYSFNHPDFDDTAAWRDRYGAYLYRSFAFPGPEIPYGVLDFGKYLSLLILDSEHSSPVISATGSQTQWLSATLNARRDVQHVFPVYHVPAYTSFRSFNDRTSENIRQHWVPLFERAGVKLAFEHHDHTFKRTKPLLRGAENPDGIVFVGDGLWGIGKRTPDTSRWYLDVANDRHHVHLVTLTATNRTVEAVDPQGTFFGDQLEQPIDGIPAAPEPVVTGLQDNAFSFTWTGVPRADKYKIIRSDGWTTETQATSFTDTEWTPGQDFSYVVEAINRAGHSRTNPTTAPAPRQVWALTNNLPWDGSGEGDMMADPNRDGRPNILEYFHGLNPRVASGLNPLTTEVDPDSGELVLRFRRNRAATDVQASVVWKADLTTPGPWSSDGVTTALEGPDPADDGIDWFRAGVPISDQDGQKFLRLQVQ
jgi:hypothetical protein